MTGIALLIDWENLKLNLQNNRRRYNPARLASDLQASALELAGQTNSEVYLASGIAFAPSRGFDTPTNIAITTAGLTVGMTHGSGQAADLSIAIRAMQLYYEQRVRFFVIVSGDSDFIPLYEELNKGGSVCHMWLIDRKHASKAVERLDRVAYVAERLHIEADAGPSPDQAELYLLLCQRIIDHGTHLGGVDHARQKITALGVIDDTTAGGMWLKFKTEHLIEDLPGLDQKGEKGKARRLAYERDAVLKPLWLADVIVYKAHHDYKGELSRGEVLSMLNRQDLSEADCSRVLDSLSLAGYLIKSGDRYLAGDVAGRYGLIGAGFRLAMAFYAVKANGQQTMGIGQLIKDHWPRFFKVGGHLLPQDSAQCADDAKCALERAIAMRMAGRCKHTRPDGNTAQGFTIDYTHPLVEFMRNNIGRAVKELAALNVTHSQRIKVDDFVNHMLAQSPKPWSRAETEYWLGLLAAERVVTWTGGELALNNGNLRKEIDTWV